MAGIHHVLIMYGQSNTRGVVSDPPSGLPISTVRLWRDNKNTTDNLNDWTDTELVDVQVTDSETPHHGIECQFALDAVAAGLANRLTILKVSRGGSLLSDFIPGTATYAILRAVLSAGRPAAAPGYLKVALVLNQGENEAVAVAETAALAWASRFTSIHDNLEDRVGLSIPRIIVRLRDSITGGNWEATVRSQQASVADHLINRDDTAVEADGIHDSGSSQNTIGSRIWTVCSSSLGWA